MRRKSRILPVFLSMIMVTGSFSWSVPKVWAEEFADSAEMNENMVISGISSGDVEDFSETDDSFSGEATFLAGADDTFLSDFAEDDSSSAEDFEESYPVVLEGNPDL